MIRNALDANASQQCLFDVIHPHIEGHTQMISVQTTVKQRRNMYFGLFDHYRRKGYPSIKIVILVHILHGLTHLDSVTVRLDLYDHAMQFCFDLVIIGMEPCIFLILQLLKLKQHIESNLE